MQPALIFACFCYIGLTSGQELDVPVHRLPVYITPLHYSINLTPQLVPPFSLEGQVQITFVTKNDTYQGQIDEIVLHLDEELQIIESNVTLLDNKNNKINIGAIENDDSNQMINIKTTTYLSKGSTYTIMLPYKGSLRKDGIGLYVDSFKDRSDMYYMSSNFYPIYGRLAFPCFDEPNFKATFQVTVIRPENYTAVSNSPVNGTTQAGTGMVSETFAVTPKISVHSLSVFIGKVLTTSFNAGSINITMIHRGVETVPSEDNILNNLISTAGNLLSYSMNSIQIILLPNVNSVANGGFKVLIFSDNFFDFSNLTVTEKLERYEFFLKQLLKQYFNHAVTPIWWSDIWLSEGITTYLQYVIMDRVVNGLPGFYPTQVLVMIRYKALKLDRSSKPLAESGVQSTEEIVTTLSDDLKKYKGAMILVMLELSLPAGTLLQALNNLLSEKLYGTASTEYFISILNITSDSNSSINVETLRSWFYEAGYPMVSVKRNQNDTVIVSQEVYCEFDSECLNTTEWKIPINYVSKNMADYKWMETIPEGWLGLKPLVLKTEIPNNIWILLNTHAQGYYRINYNDNDLSLIKEMLSDTSNFIDTSVDKKMTRGQIVDDVMTLAAQGLVDYSTALNIVSLYKHETNYFVLKSLFSSLDLIQTLLYKEAEYKQFQVYVKTLIEGISQSFTDKDSAYMATLTDALLIPWRCASSSCNTYVKIAEQFINGKYAWLEIVSKVQFHEYICVGVRYNNGSIFQNLTDAYKSTMNTSYHEIFVTGMGCVTNRNNLSSVLEEITQKPSMIIEEDVKPILQRITSITENTDDFTEFFANKAKTLEEMYGQDLLVNIILQIGEKLTTNVHADQLRRISSTKISSTAEKIINKTLSNLKTRIKWISNFKSAIMEYFADTQNDTTPTTTPAVNTTMTYTTVLSTNTTLKTTMTSPPLVTSTHSYNNTSNGRSNTQSLIVLYISFFCVLKWIFYFNKNYFLHFIY